VRRKLDRVFELLDTRIRRNADDDDVPIVATGLIPFAYGGLIKSILDWGYTPNLDFWVFPYDWRQSNRVSGQLLARFIEEKAGRNADSVDIVSHSMGGIITRAAHNYGAPIKRAVYIGCPHLGSPLAYFILHPEIDSRRFIGSAYDGYPVGPTIANTGSAESRKTLNERRKELFANFPSMYELLPDDSYLTKRPVLTADGKPAFGAEETYLTSDWAFKDNAMRTAVKDAIAFKSEIGNELPRDDSLLVCGTNQITFDSIHYRTAYHVPMTYRPTYVMQRGFSLPYDSGLGGDGYVPRISAMASLSGTPTYKNTVFVPEAHTSLPNANATAEAISRFLSG
jgi:pimeloyl-ACP methyl ester carboxylesterase